MSIYVCICLSSNNSYKIKIPYIQGGRGSAAFTETAYRVKYFKPISKEINQDASTVWT